MPVYTFSCADCGSPRWVSCAIDKRDDDRPCPTCTGQLVRQVDSGQGLVGRAMSPRTEPKSPSNPVSVAAPVGSGITMKDITIVSCGGGVKMEGGHADIDGMRIIDTPSGFDLSGGATVSMRNVTQEFTQPSGSGRRRRRP